MPYRSPATLASQSGQEASIGERLGEADSVPLQLEKEAGVLPVAGKSAEHPRGVNELRSTQEVAISAQAVSAPLGPARL